MKSTSAFLHLMHQSSTRIVFAMVSFAAAVGMTVGSADAASGSWTGASDATWIGGNWSASPVPAAGDTATFDSSGNTRTTIDLGSGVTIGTVIFDTASAAAYTIGSGVVGSQTLAFGNTGTLTMNSTVAANQLFNSNLTLGTADAGTTTITNSSTTNSLAFAGTITGGTGGTAGAKILNLNAAGGGIVVSGAINKGSASSIAVSNNGGGTLTLSGSGASALQSLGTGTINGSKVIINGQSVTAAAQSTFQTIQGFEIQSGSVAFNGGIRGASGGDNFFKVSGGTFSTTVVNVRRSSNFTTLPAAASTTTGFVVAGGSSTVGILQLGSDTTRGGSALISSGSLTVTGETRIGDNSSAATGQYSVLQVSGGSFTSNDNTAGGITLSRANNNQATNSLLLLTGGTTTAEKISFGSADNAVAGSTGTFTLNGPSASLYLGSGGIVKPAAAAYTSTINLTQGTLGAKADWSSSLDMNLSGTGTIIKAADASNAGRNISLGGALGGSGGFTKTGAGTLTLSGSNVYSGTTTISAGTLLVNGSLGNTTVSMESNGTLGGTGTIAGNVGLADGAQILFQVSDPLEILGTLSFAGSFGFDDLEGFDVQTAALGTYTVISGSNIDFTNVQNFGVGNAFVRADGNLAYFESGSLAVHIIPEPASALAGVLGGAMLLLRRRRES